MSTQQRSANVQTNVAILAAIACVGARDAVAEGPCDDPATASTWVSDLFRNTPGTEIFVRGVACDADTCKVDFEAAPRVKYDEGAAACRWVPPEETHVRGLVAHDRGFTCTIPRAACDAVWGAETGAEARKQVAWLCVEPALDIVNTAFVCEPRSTERIGFPSLPKRRARRWGVDAALGWHEGVGDVGPLGLAFGVAVDRVVHRRLAIGARVGWLGVQGLHALDPGPRVRFGRMTSRQHWELEASLRYRLVLAGADDSHAAVGVGAFAVLRHASLGVRYALALEPSAFRHVVQLATERAAMFEDGAGLPKVGLGLHAILGGWGFYDLGVVPPGVAIELPVYVGGNLVPMVRWDLLWFPRADAPRLASQTLLAGLLYFNIDGESSPGLPFGLSIAGGYGLAHGRSPRAFDDGAVVDLGVWWFVRQLSLVNLGVDGRVGVADANRALRAVFLSVGVREVKW